MKYFARTDGMTFTRDELDDILADAFEIAEQKDELIDASGGIDHMAAAAVAIKALVNADILVLTSSLT